MKNKPWYRMWPEMIRQVAGACPRVFVLEYFWSVVNGLALAATPIVLEQIFRIILESETERFPFAALAGWMLALLAVYLTSEASAGLSEYYGEVYSDISAKALFGNVNKKAGRLAAIEYEKPELLNRLEKAYPGAFRVRDVVHVIMDILTAYLPYFILYGIYLYHAHPVLPPMLVLIFLPILGSQLLKGKLYARLEDKTAVLRRQKQYYAACMSDKEYAKETRIHGLRGFFRERYRKAVQIFNRYTIETGKKAFKIDMGASLLNMLGLLGMIALLLWLVLKRQIALASFVAVLTSVRTAYDQMEEIVQQRVGALSVSLALSRNYTGFLAEEEEERSVLHRAELDTVSVQNVSFVYPDGTQALRGVTFTAERGDRVAVVGENGSGKTTLAKLLTGIYAPSAGSVSGGASAGMMELRKGSSHLFQHFNQYRMTAAENIGLSDCELKDPERMKWAMETAGFAREETEEIHLETMLGREFGGTELSGGQWQKLAIARAIYRRADLLVLDEPTAAIDPEQESGLYHAFEKCAEGKLCFLITHRLGLVKICNRILVMREGQVLDIGSHAELMQRCAYYRSLWEAQAGQYGLC
jgi:ABC-type multidrug transport system, ATPase and permease components